MVKAGWSRETDLVIISSDAIVMLQYTFHKLNLEWMYKPFNEKSQVLLRNSLFSIGL